MFLFCFVISMQIDYKIVRFNEGHTEFWYKIDMTSDLNAIKEKQPNADSIFVTYEYKLSVRSVDDTDSGMVNGTKGTFVESKQTDIHFTDFVPIYLYPGRFTYSFNLESDYWAYSDTGTIIITNTVDTACLSDLIIGKKCALNTFVYHDHAFIPTIDNEFTIFDTLVSYFELYGLRPDSLYYNVKYQVLDNMGLPVLSHQIERCKYSNIQIDTCNIALARLTQGCFTFEICVHDSVSGFQQVMREPFTVITFSDECEDKPYYADIQYLVSASEYKKFSKLDEQGQRFYLKAFWATRSYSEFEKRLNAADSFFSVHKLGGRDSERGRYYIANGPPNEKEYYTMTGWGRNIELWRYQALGVDVVFCDTREDGNPRFIVELTIGEMMTILESGYRDPDKDKKWPWLYALAPGTYDVPDIPEQ